MNSIIAKYAVFVAVFFCSMIVLGLDESHSRDRIRIVGSSTVFPFSSSVAERFGRGKFKTPLIESTGTGGGFKIFCQGLGLNRPDMLNASRRITMGEYKQCTDAGISLTEVKIGYDGIAFAWNSVNIPLDLSRREIFLALARDVVIDGKIVRNPYKNWSDISPSLPNLAIKVLGPPTTSGTRDAFLELVMEEGAKSFPLLFALSKSDKKRFISISHIIREDGAYIEGGENDNIVIQKLSADRSLIGIFGYSFLQQNLDRVRSLSIEGIHPEFDNIVDGSYSVARSLYFYVKREHVDLIPGLHEFAKNFMQERVVGNDGYLVDKGLIPLSSKEGEAVRRQVEHLEILQLK